MQLGMFMQPIHPVGRPMDQVIEECLVTIEWLDELGYSEVWHGEHYTVPWEMVPACDLVLARAFERTKQIKLCTGGYVVCNYHPTALAYRIAQMDHMLKDRFICGLAVGGTPTEIPLLTGERDVKAGLAANHRMMEESLAIMRKLWAGSEEPWRYEGEFWTVANPEPMGGSRAHIRPYRQPHPPIALAGSSPRSGTLRYAGENGMIPLSVPFPNATFLAGHWDVVQEGAEAAGRPSDRRDWRISREVFVAETDAEALAWVLDGPMGAHHQAYDIPFLKRMGWLQYSKADADYPDEKVDVRYMAEQVWLVGSPDTVLKRLIETYDTCGGFGTLLVRHYEHGRDPAYRRSLELLVNEVLPRFEKLRPAAALAAKVNRVA